MRYLLTTLFLAMLLEAQSYTQQDIRALIDAVKQAPKAEKFEKMNHLKKALRSMNTAQRRMVIRALKEKQNASLPVQNREVPIPSIPTSHTLGNPLQSQLRDQQIHNERQSQILLHENTTEMEHPRGME